MAEAIYTHLYLTKAPPVNMLKIFIYSIYYNIFYCQTSSTSTNELQSKGSSSVINTVNQDPSSQLQKDIFDLVCKYNNTKMGADVNEIAQKLAFQYGSDQNVK